MSTAKSTSIKAEMAVFESSGKRGRMMEQAYQYLMSVPPTNVEAERAFSTAGVLCTKLRSPEATSAARAFNAMTVGEFFNLLE